MLGEANRVDPAKPSLFSKHKFVTSLVAQWLRPYAPNAEEGPGSIPGQGSRSHMPQLSVFLQQLKMLWGN